jgi:hypothetical protein
MGEPMAAGAERALTEREWRSLSSGLAGALRAAGVEPRIVARAALGARVARLWRGSTPILVWGRSIYWPGAPAEASGPWSLRQMATLQHELHHLWEYATGALTPLRYGINPGNWTYGYVLTPASKWSDFGAEQRASIAEDLWLIEHGLTLDPERGALHRRVLPWAD